jgi:hypothetical protein
MAPKPPGFDLPTFFNVDGVVGAAPAQNTREDVLLIQFAFKVMADTPLAESNSGVLAAARQVKLTGVADAATVAAIRSLQADQKTVNPGTVVDGRVSPAKSGYAYGGGLWTIINLNNSIQHRHLDVWPRIDKVPSCPPELKDMVKRVLVGK